MKPLRKVVLFFIADCAPTAEEIKACKAVNGRMRNASQVRTIDNPEKCDAVAAIGDIIPQIYANKPREIVPSVETFTASPETITGNSGGEAVVTIETPVTSEAAPIATEQEAVATEAEAPATETEKPVKKKKTSKRK